MECVKPPNSSCLLAVICLILPSLKYARSFQKGILLTDCEDGLSDLESFLDAKVRFSLYSLTLYLWSLTTVLSLKYDPILMSLNMLSFLRFPSVH